MSIHEKVFFTWLGPLLGSLAASFFMVVFFKRGYSSHGVKLASFVGLSTFKLVLFCELSLTFSILLTSYGKDARVVFALLFVPTFILLLSFFCSAIVFFFLKASSVTRNIILPEHLLHKKKPAINTMYGVAVLGVALWVFFVG